jgi:exosortase E/protease (VPEID-CTERM system)
MSISMTAPKCRSESIQSAIRSFGLYAVPIVEFAAIAFGRDLAVVSRRFDYYRVLLAGSRHLFELAAAVLIVSLLVQKRRAFARREAISAAAIPGRFLLAAHLLAFAAFWILTIVLFGSSWARLQSPGIWLLTWSVCGGAMIATWAFRAFPSVWRSPAVRGILESIAIGVAVATLAASAGWLTAQFWRSTAAATLAIVDQILRLFDPAPVRDASRYIIGTSKFQVFIAPGCSGYEGIGLSFVFLLVYLWLYRDELRFPRSLLLFPIAAVLVWCLNAVRIAALILIGDRISPSIALGGFHSQAGWLTFNAICLGLAVVTHRSSWFRTERAIDSASIRSEWNPAAAHLAPLLALVATTMIAAAISSGFDAFYPVRFAAVLIAVWLCRSDRAIGRIQWSWYAVLIGAAVYAIWIALEPRGGSNVDPLPAAWPRYAAIGWIAFRVLGSVVTVPIAEELAFRGFLIRRLIDSDFESVPAGKLTPYSLVISSVLFGLLHGRWIAGIAAGGAYALVYRRRGKIGDAILAHAVSNALIAAQVLLVGDWRLWS